jgi:serine/threonine protein kinase
MVGKKADVYGFGSIIYEILFDRHPWSIENLSDYDELKNLVVNLNKRPQIPKQNFNNVELYFINIMKSCWEKDIEKRPSFKRILKSMDLKLDKLEYSILLTL